MVVPLMIVLLQSWIPESPKWLLSQQLSKQNPQESTSLTTTNSKQTNYQELYPEVYEILLRLRPEGFDIPSEIEIMLLDMQQNTSKVEVTWTEVLQNKQAMIIGCGLMLFQAITGINSVVFYSTTIFQLAGFDQSIIGTALFGAINCIMTLVSANLIDRTGRKVLLVYGTYLMLFSLLLLSIVLLCPIDDVVQGAIAVIGILLYVIGFAVGLGAVVWTVMSEIIPTHLRVKAMSLFLSINWCCNLFIGLFTLTAIDGLGGVKSSMDDDESAKAEKKGVAGLYLIFAAFTFLCILFLLFFVPETKGKTIEELNNTNTSSSSSKDEKYHAIQQNQMDSQL